MQGGGGASSSINPQQIGSMQQRGNIDSATAQQYLNMVNQVTPYGSLKYNQTGTVSGPGGVQIPQYEAIQSLSPEQQNLYNSRTGASQGLFNLGAGSFPGVSTAYNRFIDRSANAAPLPDTKGFTDQAYSALTARSGQDIATERQRIQAQNANQGVQAGSEAWNRAFQPVDRQAVDASNQATMNAQQLADMFLNREMTSRNFQNQQDLAPLQAYGGLLGLAGGGMQQPNFINTPQANVQAADLTSPFLAKAQMEQKEQEANQKATSALIGSIAGLAGTAAGGFMGGPMMMGMGGGLFGLGSAGTTGASGARLGASMLG